VHHANCQLDHVEVVNKQTNFHHAFESLNSLANGKEKFIVIDNTHLPAHGAMPHGTLTAQFQVRSDF